MLQTLKRVIQDYFYIFTKTLSLPVDKSKNKFKYSVIRNPKIIKQYEKFLENYWFENDTAKRFHLFNHIRIPLICNAYVFNHSLDINFLKPNHEFRKIKILDVSCGGGLCTEKLAELNFDVTGIESNRDLVEIAINHQKFNHILQGKSLRYYHSTIKEFAATNVENFDGIIISDILEYVPQKNKRQFLETCIKCCKDGGNIFITSLSRTPASLYWTFCINIHPNFSAVPLNWLYGIDSNLLISLLKNLRCSIRSITGIRFNSPHDEFVYSEVPSPWYFIHAVKIN